MTDLIKAANNIKEQLKYIENAKERAQVPAINRDPMKRNVVNEQLFYRALNK